MKTGELREGEERKEEWEEGRRHGTWRLLGGARRQSCIDSSPPSPCVFWAGLGATSSAPGLSPLERFSPKSMADAREREEGGGER